MRVKPLLLVLVLALLNSCSYQQQGKTYVVEETQPKIYVVEEKNPLAWEKDSLQFRNELNKWRALRDFNDEQEEFDFKSRLKNVKRVIDDKLIVGYVKELDNPEFKEVK